MAFFKDWIADSPTCGLDDAAWWAEDEFVTSFREYWGLDGSAPPDGLDPDEWRDYVDLARLAEKLAGGAAALVRPRRVREEQLSLREALRQEAADHAEMIADLLGKLKSVVSEESYSQLFWAFSSGPPDDPRTKHHFFETCLQIEAVRLFPASPGAMGSRLGQLFEFMVRAPSDFTRAYLSRVAECYVRGMKTEFAVMARAALDAAIMERLTDEEVLSEVGGSPGRDKVTLERRIQACASKEWFGEDLRRKATFIRETGRDAAHFTPGLEVESLSLLEQLVEVLRALENAA